jgi:plastocyanin
MYKKLFVLLAIFFITSITLIACSGIPGSGESSSTGTASGNQVQMNDAQFEQSSITIKKGESVTLVASTFTPHVIANGTWVNGQPKPAKEAGAPDIQNVQVDGNSSKSFGPFNTAGTFQLYCTIHPGMNLTVVVK